MATGQHITAVTDLERIASGARHSIGVLPGAADRSAGRDLLCLSRFMTAVSSTLDPEGVCAAAARELYDLAPYQQMVFRLDFPTGAKTISFSPGIRQATWTEDRPEELELVQAVPQLAEWCGNRQVVALPHGLGTIDIAPISSAGGTLTEPLRSSLLACLATALLNAIEHSRVKELAMVDGLTGLLNRRVFDEMLSLDGRKELLPLSLLLIDLDDFKHVNDRFGHQAGDEVLTCVGRMLKDSCRGTDVIARYGGEEFAVLLPTTQLVTAAEIGRRLLQLLGNKIFVFGDRPCRVTASIGAATLAKASSIAVDQLIARADQALYEAKRNGKNRVVLAERTLPKGTPAQQAGQASLPGF
jgi:diguanylate cyclase (GGDEF)-like protein